MNDPFPYKLVTKLLTISSKYKNDILELINFAKYSNDCNQKLLYEIAGLNQQKQQLKMENEFMLKFVNDSTSNRTEKALFVLYDAYMKYLDQDYVQKYTENDLVDALDFTRRIKLISDLMEE